MLLTVAPRIYFLSILNLFFYLGRCVLFIKQYELFGVTLERETAFDFVPRALCHPYFSGHLPSEYGVCLHADQRVANGCSFYFFIFGQYDGCSLLAPYFISP